jgi:hypothetical protein
MGNADRMMQWLTIIFVCALWVQVSGRRASVSGIDAPQPWDAITGQRYDPDDKAAWLRRMNIKHHGTPNPPVSGKRTEAEWQRAWERDAPKRYTPPATPPPNGTNHDCPICGCKPGEHHTKERRNSIHAHAYGGDPEDVALD